MLFKNPKRTFGSFFPLSWKIPKNCQTNEYDKIDLLLPKNDLL